jgi:hypothetical protein
VVDVVKQTHRGGQPWGSGPYHEKHAGEVVFECDAPDILAADARFQASTGRIPAKEFLVGCDIT